MMVSHICHLFVTLPANFRYPDTQRRILVDTNTLKGWYNFMVPRYKTDIFTKTAFFHFYSKHIDKCDSYWQRNPFNHSFDKNTGQKLRPLSNYASVPANNNLKSRLRAKFSYMCCIFSLQHMLPQLTYFNRSWNLAIRIFALLCCNFPCKSRNIVAKHAVWITAVCNIPCEGQNRCRNLLLQQSWQKHCSVQHPLCSKSRFFCSKIRVYMRDSFWHLSRSASCMNNMAPCNRFVFEQQKRSCSIVASLAALQIAALNQNCA